AGPSVSFTPGPEGADQFALGRLEAGEGPRVGPEGVEEGAGAEALALQAPARVAEQAFALPGTAPFGDPQPGDEPGDAELGDHSGKIGCHYGAPARRRKMARYARLNTLPRSMRSAGRKSRKLMSLHWWPCWSSSVAAVGGSVSCAAMASRSVHSAASLAA